MAYEPPYKALVAELEIAHNSLKAQKKNMNRRFAVNKVDKVKNNLDMIYLAACALHGTIPSKKRIAEADLEGVMKQAARQSMQGIVYLSLKNFIKNTEDAEKVIDSEILSKFKYMYSRFMKKLVMFDIEREKVLGFLEEQGIWYMPLKGVILQHYYPELGMRQMADNDILFDERYRSTVKKYMIENGYDGEKTKAASEAGCHDTYLKKPFLNFEMHYALYAAIEKDIHFREYYSNIKERLIKDEGNEFGYHMSDEDFYIYCTAHSYKHYSGAGNGIRSLMDIYVYISNKKDSLDFDYINRELEKLGILDFEKTARSLAFKLFSKPNDKNALNLSDTESEFLMFYMDSGVYGTKKIGVRNQLSSFSKDGKITFWVKVKYVFRRLFPKENYYLFCCPIAYKYKILIPGVLFIRFWKFILKKPKSLISELKALKIAK